MEKKFSDLEYFFGGDDYQNEKYIFEEKVNLNLSSTNLSEKYTTNLPEKYTTD